MNMSSHITVNIKMALIAAHFNVEVILVVTVLRYLPLPPPPDPPPPTSPSLKSLSGFCSR